VIGIHSRVGKWIGENMSVPIAVFTEHWDRLLAGEFIGEGPFAKKPVKGSGFLGLASEANPQGGLRVTKVGKDSPAEAAGVREGDILNKLNGTELKDRAQFQALLKEMAEGDEITLDLVRDGKSQTLTLNLGAR
jgi:serine protease Do